MKYHILLWYYDDTAPTKYFLRPTKKNKTVFMRMFPKTFVTIKGLKLSFLDNFCKWWLIHKLRQNLAYPQGYCIKIQNWEQNVEDSYTVNILAILYILTTVWSFIICTMEDCLESNFWLIFLVIIVMLDLPNHAQCSKCSCKIIWLPWYKERPTKLYHCSEQFSPNLTKSSRNNNFLLKQFLVNIR